MPWSDGVCNLLLLICNAVFIFFTCLCCTYPIAKSLFSHNLHFESALNLLFNPCSDGSVCSFPVANISLPDEFFSEGITYKVGVHMQMADSEHNRQIGVVQVLVRFLDQNENCNKIMAKSLTLPHKSWYVRLARTLFYLPLYLLGLSEEIMKVAVKFDGTFEQTFMQNIVKIQVEVQSTKLLISAAVVNLEAELGWIRYLLYYYPTISSLIVFLTFFVIMCAISTVYWTGKSALIIITTLENLEKDRAKVMQTLLASGGKCPEYCGRIQFENATCGKCLWTTSPDPASDWSECRPCASPLSLYDWLYVALMSCAPIVLNAYAIDYYKTDKCPRILNVLHHVSSFIECALSFVCTLLILNPKGLPYLVGCNVSKLSDWYPMFYNPYIDYTEKLQCTQEIVYPLYSLPFIYYALCLVNLTVFRTILCCKYPFRKTGSNTAVYASLYILPIVTLVHAVFAGFIYYGFPYLLLIATLSTNAFYLSNYEQQNMKSLLKDTVTEPKNLLVVVFHCLCIAFCFVSIDLFRSPVMSIVMLLLTPIPTLFYVITINFSAPMP